MSLGAFGPRGSSDAGNGASLSTLISSMADGVGSSPSHTSNSPMPVAYSEKDAGDRDRWSALPGPGSTGSPVLVAILMFTVLASLAVILLTSSKRQTQDALGKLTKPDVMVWVNKNSGDFYCQDSILYRQGEGQLMKQADAIQLGFQPAINAYCQPSAADPAPATAKGR